MAHSDFIPPQTEFEWRVYANATFAGLATLIPIIGLDWAFEELFRRRMVVSIAKYRGQNLPPFASNTLNSSNTTCLQSCLMLPVILTYGLLKKLSRKILYFLTLKEATDKLSYYWHRAFLIDYMLLAGHLEAEDSAQAARQAMDQTLENTITSPLYQLARQVINHTKHILRTLRRARKGVEDEVAQQKKSIMLEHWGDFESYLQTLAAEYNRLYQEIRAQHQHEGVT